ncbi:hypothetical protein PVL29_018373 [Vitis rotundifolia]|uniref:ATPase AAA-type core domain-containing protein n=1 Tax=Vitis rotundifolia TaxID=103349 RepID=A0AA38Z4W7_VITRO|nr:hypothetical protein PVL29_018373 [Vitis rotundifolia]
MLWWSNLVLFTFSEPIPARIEIEEKPNVTYNDVGGCKEQIEKMRELVDLPMLHHEKFVKLGIDPPKGVICYGPSGIGKTLLPRAMANRTDACFIRVIGSELVHKYMAHSQKACIVFFFLAKYRPPNALPEGEKPLYLHIPEGAHSEALSLTFHLHRKNDFLRAEGPNPVEISIAYLPGVLKLKKELCGAQSLNESHVPDAVLERLVYDTSEFPPEVIKAISGKGDPLKNFFFFDAIDGKGIIEDISNRNPGKRADSGWKDL